MAKSKNIFPEHGKKSRKASKTVQQRIRRIKLNGQKIIPYTSEELGTMPGERVADLIALTTERADCTSGKAREKLYEVVRLLKTLKNNNAHIPIEEEDVA